MADLFADFDRISGDVDADRDRRLRAAMGAAPAASPEAAARANQLSDKLGQPFDVVAANLDDFEQDERLAHVAEVGRRNPVVGEFLQDPRRAALAQDDVDALDRLTGLFSGAAAAPLTGMNPLAAGITQSLLQRVGVGVGRGLGRSEFAETFERETAASGASAWHAVTDFIDQTTQRPTRELFGMFAELAEGTEQEQAARVLAQSAADPLGVAGQAAESAGVVSEIQKDREGQVERIGGRPSVDVLARDPAAWAEQASAYYTNMGTASLPAMLLAIASRRPAAGGAIMGASEGSQTYADLRGDGMDRGRAAMAAVGSGAVEASLGTVGLQAAFRPGLRGLVGGPAIEAGTETLTTAGQIEIEDYARQERTGPMDRLMAMWDSAVLGFGFGAVERGGSATLDALTPQRRADIAIEDGQRVQRSAVSAAHLGAVLDAVAGAKLGERSEADMRAFLQQTGAAGSVYLSAEQATTLFQSEALADMVGGAEALEVQLASGDVAIPTDVFLARAARMPNVDEIKRHIRARAEDVSLAEVEAIDFDALAQQLGLEDAAERAEPGTVDARQQVVQDVMGQLIATDRYTPAAAEAQAKLWGAAMDRLATMAGTDAFSLYQRYMGGIEAGTNAVEPSQTLNQSALFDMAPTNGTREVKVGDTTITYGIGRDGQTGEVILVETPPKARGQGSARQAMEQFMAAADAAGVTMFLTAEPMGKGGASKSALQKFYKSLGFRENKGRKADFRSRQAMVRDPVERLNQPAIDQTQTPQFREWFGESKVVDAQGKPLVVYHGTDSTPFDTFDRAKGGNGPSKFGFWFTNQESFAEIFGGNLMPVYVKVENPKRITLEEWNKIRDRHARDGSWFDDWREGLIAQGHDGLVVSGGTDQVGRFAVQNPDVVAVFEPTQIKSATANRGTFDPNDPSILNQSAVDPADRTLLQRVADAALGLFNQQPSAKGPRGQLRIFPDRRMSISLFETADRSTFLHESGHFFLEVFRDIAADPNAPQQARDDFAALLDWFGVESADHIAVEHHEQFARGFEAYLMEGKAPSADLRSVFASFKAWLTSIYRTLTSLDVTLSDDVRGVMDRLLATEEEIEIAQVRQGMEPLAIPTGEAGQIGLTEKQFADYAAMVEAATEEARAEVTAKLMAAHDRAARRWYKEETANVRAEVEAEFGSQPVFRAARVLAGGRTFADGSPVPEALQGMKLDRAALVDVYGEDYLKRLPKLYAREGGVDQDAAAAALGFPSGDALVVALANRGDLQARVEAETQARMRERHGDPMTDGTLAEVAMDAVHNNARVKLLQRELDMLADLAGNPRLDARLMTGIARNRMAQTALRDIRPNDYLAAERKAARQATQAAARGDYADALQAKRKQALNAALYREARHAQDRAAKTTAYLRKSASNKTRQRVGKTAGKFYVDALDAIFDGIEVRGASRPEVARRSALRDWVRRMQEDGNSTAIPESLLARVESERVTNLADMTVAEVQGLREAVENLLHLARVKNKLQTAKGQREWEDAKAEMVARLEASPVKHGRGGISDADRALFERIGDLYAAGSNWVLQPETLIEWLDGGTTGPFHDLLWDQAQAAERKREALNRLVGDKLQSALGSLSSGERKMLDRRYRIESLDADVSGHSILSALLNMGNEGNRDKLTRGGRVLGDRIVQFTPDQLAEMFGKLTKAQAEVVQGIWDAVDQLWPEIVALEESMNGMAPERVVATPFTVMTRDGPVALRGGYYPVMYDPKGAQAGQFSEDEQAKRVLSGQTPVRASTSKGHTEARTDFAAPLLLDYHSVLTRHMDGVIGDIAYRQFLRQVYKVLGDADIRRMIDNRVGAGAAVGLRKGFERGATGNFSLAGPLFGPFQKVADATMSNLSSAALGFRIPLALANVVAVPIQAAIRVKPRYVLSGLRDYYLSGGVNIIGNMRRNAEAVQRLSPLMLRRAEARSVELSSIISNLRGKRGFRAKMIEMAMSIHQWTVPLAENAAWMGAYQQAMAGGASMADAITAADKAIRQTQTKTSAMELSQGEGGYMRMFMQFAGPLVIMNNRLQEAGMRGLRGDVKSWPQALGVWFAVAMGAAWSFEIIMGRGPDDDEPEASDWAWWAAKKLALLPFAAFPLIRDVASFADSGFSRGTPLAEAGKTLYEATIGTAEALFADDEVNVEHLLKTQVRAAGVAYGIPSNQLLRTGDYLMAVSTGEHEIGNPAAEAYFLAQGAPDDD